LEICQFVFAIGAGDITDIITNTLGTVIGAGIYFLLTLIFRNRTKLDKILQILSFTVTVAAVGFILLVVLMTH
jgi:glycopeptide antibiotics resistance protein